MSVAEILQALAANAGQAQLRTGAIYGNLVSGVSQIPEQVMAAKERDAALALHTSQVQQQMDLERARAQREAQLAKHQDAADALALQTQQHLGAIIGAGFEADPAKFDIGAAGSKAKDLGRMDLMPTVAKVHDEFQTKLTEHDPNKALVNPSGAVVVPAVPKLPSTTGELDARQMFLVSKKNSGVPLTAQEQNDMDAYQTVKAPKTRTADDQALDAYAKSIGKTKAEDLTYADRQTFEKDKEAIKSTAAFQQHMRERQYDNANQPPVKATDQNKLEQEYRTVLARGLSSRSGGLGLEDAKVQQANHLTALMDQSYDPKTDTYNIPRVQQTELAMGLARLISPGGVVSEKTVNDINQATAKGDFNKALTYVTGTPFNGTTQDLVKMYRDSIIRQGQTAQQNREGEMAYLRGLAPTDLEEPRRQALEATSLNPLRQSKVLMNDKGERRLVVSVDGGKTWQ